MASKTDLKTMIKCFRVHELQLLLTYAGRSKVGKKQDLLNRALSLLNHQYKPLAFKIRHLYNSMQNCYNNSKIKFTCQEMGILPAPTCTRDINAADCDVDDDCITIIDSVPENEKMGVNAENFACGKEARRPKSKKLSTLELTKNPLYYPIHPNVKFKKLPFYKVLHVLLKPATLVPKDCNFQQKISFLFYLSHQEADAICSSKYMKSGMEEYSVQGQLRFCVLETTAKQDDSFPSGLVVKVNNRFCNIQEQTARKRKDIFTREIAPPINITPLMKIRAGVVNKIDVQWNIDYNSAYVIGIFVVQKKNSQNLLKRLKAKAVRSADQTRKMIKEKLNEEYDSEILTTSLRISLVCPLGKVRLQFPCRASTCQHLQCFDACVFLQMNEMKPTWICPICDNPAEYDQLIIDGYFLEILSSDQLPADVNEIEIHNDGTWASVVISDNVSDNNSTLMKEELEEVVIEESKILNSDKEEMITEEIKSRLNTSKSNPILIEKKKFDIIDLTVSDSDDEPLIWYKRRESSNSQRNEDTNSSVNSNKCSPSVINLTDSDSSDSLALILSNPISPRTSPAPLDVLTDFSGSGAELADSAMPRTSDSIMPWFSESAVFF